MLTRMTRMARMLTHMLTRMARWLAYYTHSNLASHRVHQIVVQNVKKITKGALLAFPLCFFLFCFFFPSPVLEIYLKHATMHSTNPSRHFYSFCC